MCDNVAQKFFITKDSYFIHGFIDTCISITDVHTISHFSGACGSGKISCALNRNQCITQAQVCNGVNDCFNGTDEQGCSSAGSTSESDRF